MGTRRDGVDEFVSCLLAPAVGGTGGGPRSRTAAAQALAVIATSTVLPCKHTGEAKDVLAVAAVSDDRRVVRQAAIAALDALGPSVSNATDLSDTQRWRSTADHSVQSGSG